MFTNSFNDDINVLDLFDHIDKYYEIIDEYLKALNENFFNGRLDFMVETYISIIEYLQG